MEASAITHGDKFFLTRPMPTVPTAGGHDVYGANGAGTIVAAGDGVPVGILGKRVAIYKSLARSVDTVGLWCERAQVPYTSCFVLPDRVRARDLCGSLANVLTVHAFLDEMAAEGRKGIVVTAGNSATGLVTAALVRRRNVPAIFLVRSAAAREALLRHGVEHVVATTVFDGVGGELLSRILPHLPVNAAIRVYGFLGGLAPITLPTMLLMRKNLTFRRFTVLESATISDPARLAAAVKEIGTFIDDELFRTQIGEEFPLGAIDRAMGYEAMEGGRALLVS